VFITGTIKKNQREVEMSDFMEIAFKEAESAALLGEVPVGAVLVSALGEILAQSGNQTETDFDPTAHAEILVLRQGAKIRKSPRLNDCDLYVTLEPCTMCAAAISFARLRRVIFAAYDAKGGGIEHGSRFFTQTTCHHKPEIISGVQEQRAGEMLKKFFVEKRS
jgi:tRNA(Arg) A34 adenosine deaminase TadA